MNAFQVLDGILVGDFQSERNICQTFRHSIKRVVLQHVADAGLMTIFPIKRDAAAARG